MKRQPAALLLLLALVVQFLPSAPVQAQAPAPGVEAPANTYLVTTTADSGTGSLRQAILDANANPGLDTISFAVGAAGSQQSIALTAALPAISSPVHLDGWSQGGDSYAGPPLFEINGSGLANWNTVDGLQISAGNSTVRGLAINYFNIAINLTTAGGNVIAGNYLGLALDGVTPVGNRTGMRIAAASDNNRIGTDADGIHDAGERNVISASGYVQQNNSTGILIDQGSDYNWIAGNYIGTDATGTQDRGNISNGITTGGVTIIGTNGDGVGDALEGNLISGNNGHGLALATTSSGSRVAGNKIGTDATGTAAIPNNSNGASVGPCSPGQCSNYIIGTNGDGVSDALEGNLISGNGADGVFIVAGSIDNNVVAGNKIGTDITGTTAIPNGDAGIYFGGDFGRIGTNHDGISDDLEGNLISGNGDGSGSDDNGINIPSGADNHLIAGNLIGVQADGFSPLGNLLHGIYFNLSTAGHIIGGSGQSQANRIAHNGGDGISTSTATSILGNRIQGNHIFENAGLGIDLSNNGTTPNDAGDVDVGPNNLQNYPALNAAAASGANVIITGTLNSAASTIFTLDFYSSGVCDPSGNGEGQLYLGAGLVTTDANGDASFTIFVAGYASNGDSVTATAADPAGNTSEFSTCVQVVGEIPIGGLQAFNDSPTSLGLPTHFTTTLSAGTGVSYFWDFGDGATGSGANPSYVYPATGSFTATVTATNVLGSAAAATPVTILLPPTCSATPDEGVTVFGSADAAAVQQAVDAAAPGATVKIAGTCTGVSNTNGTSQTVFISNTLTLAGGYTTANWTTADPANHPTVLDAAGLGRVVLVAWAFPTPTKLENLILANGAAAGSGAGDCVEYGCGGGLFTWGSLNLSNVTFQNNLARRGGGAYVSGELQAVNTDWQDNTAIQRGGALDVYGGAAITGGLWQGNAGSYGGGVFTGAGLAISGTQFISNTATSLVAGSGGAIYAAGALDITNALFQGNQSYTGAGAVLHAPGATDKTLSIAGSQFIHNSTLNAAAQGGALYTSAAASSIETSLFQGNRAPGSSGSGGAIVAFKAITLTETTLISNTAGAEGGAIYHWGLNESGSTTQVQPLVIERSWLAGNQAGSRGGGLYFRLGFAAENVPVRITNTTFHNNTASTDGGGAYLPQPATVEDSAFQGNTSLNAAGGGLFASSQLVLNRSTLTGNQAATNGGGLALQGAGAAASLISNSVFAGNTTTTGSATVFVSGGRPVDILHTTLAGIGSAAQGIAVLDSNVQITNTILVSYTVGLLASGGAAVTADHSLFHNNQVDVQGATNLNPVYGSPQFLNMTSGDFHLSLGSPAIDAGAATSLLFDYDGDLRPIIAQSDIGADEFGDSALVDPGATTVMTGTVGADQQIIVRIPPGAVGGQQAIRLLPVFPPIVSPRPPQRPLRPGFQLSVTSPASLLAAPLLLDPFFLLPVEITVTYLDADLAGLNESSLYLAVLDETSGEWLDATTTCPQPGSITRSPSENWITITTCASGEFALIGSPGAGAHFIYLPILNR